LSRRGHSDLRKGKEEKPEELQNEILTACSARRQSIPVY
jgi:hypothetical protein